MAFQLGFQLGAVLDDSVVDPHHLRLHRVGAGAHTAAADVGVSVDEAGSAVGGPAGVSNAAAAGKGRAAVCFFSQIAQLAHGLHHLGRLITVPDGQARRVIAPVFQLGQPVQQNGGGPPPPGKAYDSAHDMYSLRRICCVPLYSHRIPLSIGSPSKLQD